MYAYPGQNEANAIGCPTSSQDDDLVTGLLVYILLLDQLLSGGLESETEKKLKNYYELYEEAEKKLECREVEIMELKRKVQSSTGTGKCYCYLDDDVFKIGVYQ